MISSKPRQQGAALLVALVLLAVITVLTVTNMREVTLEGRMTANRLEAQQLLNATDSALREAEKRFYGPGNVAAKLEASTDNCKKSNTYQRLTNKPCLLSVPSSLVRDFLHNPLKLIKENSAFNNWTGAKTETASDTTYTPWMPYRGTVSGQTSSLEHKAYWNSVLVDKDTVEYNEAIEGKGTYYYLINAQAADRFAAQSTIANISLGLNN
ncbi:pilus assembly protein PilX [Pseudomonas fluvialis]|uniref:Pilus assembly protein PilX n=1 Tax=Pseudomonas fluvialis TaxID=1793966 RepID=A0A2I0CSV1_9PSED|nr:PilX N-terminal domain-containing pilus assembly protein [Pseudomonas pharmacofabricae]PKF72169.1 pilus assembly protein PilX [Pseudomonas pharmacofabricae]